MAVGDVVSDIQSIAAGAFLAVQPTSGAEWVIHNCYHEGPVEFYFYDGTNSLLFDSEAGGGVHAKYAFHVTNSKYLRIKNTNTAAKLIGYDGMVSK